MGVLLDGVNDYYLRGGGLTGAVDGTSGVLFAWLRIDGSDGSPMRVFSSASNRVLFERLPSNKLRFTGRDDLGVNQVVLDTLLTYTASSAWLEGLIVFNTSIPVAHFLVNGVDALDTQTLVPDGVVDFTQTEWAIGASVAGTLLWDGGLAELFFAPAQYLDVSVEANLRRCIDADGSPNTHTGVDGSLPTGTVPLMYMAGGKENFPRNLGSGGAFSPASGAAPLTLPFPVPVPTRARVRHGLSAEYHR